MKGRITASKLTRRLLLLIGVIGLTLLFSIQGVLTSLMAPLAMSFVRAGTWISSTVFWWRGASQITAEELENLYAQRTRLAVDAAAFAQLKEENELLKQELGFIQRSQVRYRAAHVLSKSISRSLSRFVIDLGSDQGVELGSAVVTGEGVFVGKVIERSSQSATVSAATDPTHSVAVSLLNTSRTIGVASGSTGDLLKIDFIPTDEQIHENDLVVTSGLEPLVPSGLLVGIVNTVEQELGSPFQQAVLEPLADTRLLTDVLVLTSS